MVPAGFSALASIEASSGSAMFFLNDLIPLAKSPIRLLTLPPPNSRSTTSSTTIQCQMLKLPIVPPCGGGGDPAAVFPARHDMARGAVRCKQYWADDERRDGGPTGAGGQRADDDVQRRGGH